MSNVGGNGGKRKKQSTAKGGGGSTTVNVQVPSAPRQQQSKSMQRRKNRLANRQKALSSEAIGLGETTRIGAMSNHGFAWAVRALHPAPDEGSIRYCPIGIPDGQSGNIATFELRQTYSIATPVPPPPESNSDDNWNVAIITTPVIEAPIIAIGSSDPINLAADQAEVLFKEIFDSDRTVEGTWTTSTSQSGISFLWYRFPVLTASDKTDRSVESLARKWRYQYFGTTTRLDTAAMYNMGHVYGAQFTAEKKAGTFCQQEPTTIAVLAREYRQTRMLIRGFLNSEGRAHHWPYFKLASDSVLIDQNDSYTTQVYATKDAPQGGLAISGMPTYYRSNMPSGSQMQIQLGFSFELSTAETSVAFVGLSPPVHSAAASTVVAEPGFYIPVGTDGQIVGPDLMQSGLVTRDVLSACTGLINHLGTGKMEMLADITASDHIGLIYLGPDQSFTVAAGKTLNYLHVGLSVVKVSLEPNSSFTITNSFVMDDNDKHGVITVLEDPGSLLVATTPGYAFTPIAAGTVTDTGSTTTLTPPPLSLERLVAGDSKSAQRAAKEGDYMPIHNWNSVWEYVESTETRVLTFDNPSADTTPAPTVNKFTVEPNVGFGVQWFTGISARSTLRVQLHAGFEVQTIDTSPWSPFLKQPPRKDDRALSLVSSALVNLPSSFPQSANDASDMLANIAGAVTGIPELAPVASALMGLGKRLVARIQNRRAARGKRLLLPRITM
ncbi:capsid protein [Hubei astro-like virus]|uniref:capsid protein n=1 Tax=Hubei astro-like virus TaxID=1922837 RepID=UPI00090B591D|nr:capsid protein [Hubei astro-like virus]APG79049.1 capsid protein [Hubei astro-like virus]